MLPLGESQQISDTVPWKRVRYLMTFMTMFMVLTAFAARNALSIAIVAMTNNSTNINADTFEWDGSIQGNILSAFFWGYTATTLSSSVLITRFGTRNLLICAFTLNTIMTCLMPTAAYIGWGALCGARVIQGVCQCSLLPSMMAIMAKWLVPAERDLLGSICWSGVSLGILISMAISGAIASSTWAWPGIFYVFGSVSLVWTTLWFFVGYDAPGDHPFITKEEKEYIESFYSKQLNAKSFQVPWKSILTSMPAWGNWVAQISHTWGFYIIMSEMPTYMNDVLHYDITQNGLLMALPYISQLVFTFIYGGISNFMQARGILVIRQRRRLFNTISMLGPVVGLFAISFMGVKEKGIIVALVSIQSGILAGICVGYQLSLLELAPKFSSVVIGVSNTLANTVTIILPIAVSAIVHTKGSESQWQTVFLISSAFYLIGAVVFFVTVPNGTQSWNEISESDPEKDVLER